MLRPIIVLQECTASAFSAAISSLDRTSPLRNFRYTEGYSCPRSLRFRVHSSRHTFGELANIQTNFCGDGRIRQKSRVRTLAYKPPSLSRCGNIYSRRYTQQSSPPQIRGPLCNTWEQPVLMVNITLRIIKPSAPSNGTSFVRYQLSVIFFKFSVLSKNVTFIFKLIFSLRCIQIKFFICYVS